MNFFSTKKPKHRQKDIQETAVTKNQVTKKQDPTQFRRRATDKPPTKARIRQSYERPTSFTNLLPWLEYEVESQCFLLDDGYSVAALFELETVGSEARTPAFLAESFGINCKRY